MNLTIEQSQHLKALGFPQILNNGDYFFKEGIGYIYTQPEPVDFSTSTEITKRPTIGELIVEMVKLCGRRVGVIASATHVSGIIETDGTEIDMDDSTLTGALYGMYVKLAKHLLTKQNKSMDDQSTTTPPDSTETTPATPSTEGTTEAASPTGAESAAA